MLRVYVGAPFTSAPRVREVHALLEKAGCKYTSVWAELATDAENLVDERARVQRVTWEINARSLDHSDVMLVLSEPAPLGGELFAEIGRALAVGTPVLWTGRRRILSCYAPGTKICETLDDALNLLGAAAKSPATAKAMLLHPAVEVVCPRCGCRECKSAPFIDSSRHAWQCPSCGAMFENIAATRPRTGVT